MPDPHIVRVGCIYALCALYYAQPKDFLVRIYVPLHLLRGLTWMASQSAGAAAALKKLHADKAFVVGAVRRPISGTREAKIAQQSAKS